MKQKRNLAIALAAILAFSSLTACGSDSDSSSSKKDKASKSSSSEISDDADNSSDESSAEKKNAKKISLTLKRVKGATKYNVQIAKDKNFKMLYRNLILWSNGGFGKFTFREYLFGKGQKKTTIFLDSLAENDAALRELISIAPQKIYSKGGKWLL